MKNLNFWGSQNHRIGPCGISRLIYTIRCNSSALIIALKAFCRQKASCGIPLAFCPRPSCQGHSHQRNTARCPKIPKIPKMSQVNAASHLFGCKAITFQDCSQFSLRCIAERANHCKSLGFQQWICVNSGAWTDYPTEPFKVVINTASIHSVSLTRSLRWQSC